MDFVPAEFDVLFDVVVPPEPKAPGGGPSSLVRKKRTPDEETRVRRAMTLFHRSDYRGCAEAMRALQADGLVDSRVDAYHAASTALAGGDLVSGLQSCLVAVKKAGPVADVFCALGTVLLSTGDRARAHATFSRGLKIDPLHPYLRAKVRSMGMRRPPVLRSLPREHVANRFLGALRQRLGGPALPFPK